MAVSPLQLDVGLAGPALTAGLPPISALRRILGQVTEASGFEALSLLAGNVWYGKSQGGSSGREGMPPVFCQDFFSDGAQWRANKRRKPAWLESQLDTCDCGMKGPPECVPASGEGQGALVAHEGQLEVEIRRKLWEDGRISDAVDALTLLVQRGCHVRNNLFYRVLKRCIAIKDLVLGRRVHALSVKSGYQGDAFLATHLIGLYSSHGRLEEAMRVFAKVPTPSAYNWATIIFAYGRHGEAAQAIRLYRQMRESAVEPDNRVYVAVLKACASAGDLVTGKEVHAHILESPGKPDIFVQNGLLDMYAKCRSLEDARRVFDSLPETSVVTWTAMMSGYTHQGMGQEALSLYSTFQQQGLFPPDSVTFVCLLQACASVGVEALQQGKQLHAQIEELKLQDDVVVGGSLVNMYAKCGSLEVARRVFDRLLERDVVTWNTMLAGYAQQGMGQEALSLYTSMKQEGISPPDSVTFVSVLQACASVGVEALHQGKELHALVEERGLHGDVVVGGSLVNMYAKCGSIGDARRVFDRLSDKNVVAWNAMIAGYVQHGMGEEALSLYTSMQREGVSPDPVTFACLLQACVIVAGLALGKQLHAEIEERGMQDVVVGAALVNMYAKCGSMFDSQQVFDSLSERTIEAWNALVGGYSRQGDSDVVFDLFDRMTVGGIEPNSITFLSVLAVCSHVGLVEKGRRFFEVMRTGCGIRPTVEHYTCMMDLLGRAGHLDEALQMAKTLPFPPNGSVWHTLLGSCLKWNNVEIGQQAFEFAVRLDGNDAASYVLMSNIYAKAEMWEEAEEMQARRKKCGVWKTPGQCWWTDMGGVVHMFAVVDKHPQTGSVYARQ